MMTTTTEELLITIPIKSREEWIFQRIDELRKSNDLNHLKEIVEHLENMLQIYEEKLAEKESCKNRPGKGQFVFKYAGDYDKFIELLAKSESCPDEFVGLTGFDLVRCNPGVDDGTCKECWKQSGAVKLT